jgi:hypothetical protein
MLICRQLPRGETRDFKGAYFLWQRSTRWVRKKYKSSPNFVLPRRHTRAGADARLLALTSKKCWRLAFPPWQRLTREHIRPLRIGLTKSLKEIGLMTWDHFVDRSVYTWIWYSKSFLFIEKTIMEKQTSAIVLSPNLVLCCGKDGQMRLFGDFYEVKNLPKTFCFLFLFIFLAKFSNITLRSWFYSNYDTIYKQ